MRATVEFLAKFGKTLLIFSQNLLVPLQFNVIHDNETSWNIDFKLLSFFNQSTPFISA